MPRVKRWFPVSQLINDDPDVWRLTDECGDHVLRVFLEVLKILDVTENCWQDTKEGWEAIFRKCRMRPKNRQRLHFELTKCLQLGHFYTTKEPQRLHFGARNYWKYHGTQEPQGIVWVSPPNRTDPNHSYYQNNKNQKPATPEPSADSKKSESKKLDPAIKTIADKVYATNPIKFARLVVWIKEAEKNRFETGVIVAALERFLPYANSVVSWYPYLDKLIEKCQKDFNRDRHEAEHRQFLEEAREMSSPSILSLVQGLADAKSK